MTAKKLEQIIPQTSVVVRRVFRMGDGFICGICRVQHKNLDKATRCLNTCWRIIQHGPPFIPFRKLGKLEYACIYCMRSFVNHQDARQCAEECSSRLSLSNALGPVAKVNRPKRTWGLQTLAPPVRAGTPTNADLALRELEAAAEANRIAAEAKLAAKLAQEAANAAAPGLAAAALAADDDGSKGAEKGPKIPKDRTKKFERHGSKYVCLVCQSKYFTKEEVEACWDKHD